MGHGETNCPDIAFVGEAPGEKEASLGVPFIGPAGSFLKRVVGDLGIDIGRCYFTNTCLCYPPSTQKKPSAAMAKACAQNLLKELEVIKPKLIIALGTTAARYGLGYKSTITKVHGHYQEISLDSEKVGVVATWHPAGVLHEPDRFTEFLAELEYAISIANGEPPLVQPPYQNYRFVTNQKKFDKFVKVLSTKKYVALDLETDGTEWMKDSILCAGFSWKRGTAYILDWSLIKNNLENLQKLNSALTEVRLAMHNGIFDWPFLLHNGLTHANYYIDTMVAHALLDERSSHGLEYLAVKYYRAPNYKETFWNGVLDKKGKSFKNFAEALQNAPKESLYLYNGADVDYTYRLAVDLVDQIKEEGLVQVLKEIEMPSARYLTEFSMTGLLVDRNYMEARGAEWRKPLVELAEKLQKLSGRPDLNPNSPKQLAEIMFDELKLSPFGGRKYLKEQKIPEDVISACIKTVSDEEALDYWTSQRTAMSSGMKVSSGDFFGLPSRSTSTYHLYWLKQQHEFPELLIQYRHFLKRNSMYYEGIAKWMYSDGRIRPRYKLTAARTGRKQTTAPAIHNLPRGDEIYNLIIPDPGWCLIHADYSQAEMRIMAHFCEDEKLLKVLSTTDPHTTTAMEMFKLTEAEVEKLTKTELAHKRIAAKMITYGLPYGRSPQGLAPQLQVSVAEAKDYMKAYFDGFPGLRDWLSRIRKEGVKRQYAVNVFGRKRSFPLIANKHHLKEVQRQIGNFPMQSTSNDLTLLAYSNSITELRKAGIPVKPGAHIHDSVNFSVPIPFWKAAVQIIVDLMVKVPFESNVDFPVACEVGDRWGHLIVVHENGQWVDPDPKGDRDDLPYYLKDLTRGEYKQLALLP